MNRLGTGTVIHWRRLCLALLTFAFAASLAPAETPGISDTSILIGSCSALDGPAHFLGRQTVLGASAYLHMINDDGGV